MKFDRIDEFFDAADKGDGSRMREIGSEAAKNLTEEQRKIVDKAMTDPEFLNSILSTPKAQELMKKLKGGN